MNEESFTIEELLAALEAARPSTADDPAAMTIRQLREKTGGRCAPRKAHRIALWVG